MTILKETDTYLVINKPAGLLVHGDGSTDEETLADQLLAAYPHIREVGEPFEKEGKMIWRPGIVHRLDRETSGVLVVAKTEELFRFLKRQFQKRTIKKQYVALAWGKFKKPRGLIEAPIGRDKNDFRKWTTGDAIRGKKREAITQYVVEKEYSYTDQYISLVRLYPKTGRTHQLRVHLKGVGHPVLCDRRYGTKKTCPDGLSRMALHAESITFLDQNKQQQTATAPRPNEFLAFLQKL